MGADNDSMPLPRWTDYGRKIHALASSMGFGAWTTVRGLPCTCEEIGFPTPRWADELLQHVEILLGEVPPVVLQVLADGGDKGRVWCRSRAARQWGSSVGIWEDDASCLELTPLGDVLAELWCERMPEEPSRVEECIAAGIRNGAIVATRRGSIGLLTWVYDDGRFDVAYRRGQTGQRRLGDRIEILAGPGEPHPMRAELAAELLRPCKRRRRR